MVLFRAVHLQPDLHSAIIVPIHESEENLKDTRLIISDLKELFKVDCDIDVVTEGLYLMRLQAFDAPTHYPHLLSVLGRPANPYIEQSRRILPWYRLLNEMQMFMHQHEVNQDRMRRGLLSLNSLWFWGAGSIPTGYSADLAWYSDDALLNRFAASLGLDISPLDALGGLGGGNDVAVIDLRLIELLKTGFDMEPDQLLLDIEHRLLTPILAAARRDRRKLLLRAGYEYDYLLTSFSDLKFWRPTRNLAHWGEREFGL